MADNDPSLGQSHTIYQIQDKKQVLVFPPPYTNGKFQTAALDQVSDQSGSQG